MRHSLILVKPSGLPIISTTAQTDRKRGRYSQLGPPLYSPTFTARSGPDTPGGHCLSSYIRRQTGGNPCGIPLTLPPNNRGGSDHLFRRGIAGPHGRQPDRQTRRLELAVDHETGKIPPDYVDEKACLIFGPDIPNTNPYSPPRFSRCLGRRGSEGTPVPGASDYVLCTKLGPPPGTH